jgi:hypothetical protein
MTQFSKSFKIALQQKATDVKVPMKGQVPSEREEVDPIEKQLPALEYPLLWEVAEKRKGHISRKAVRQEYDGLVLQIYGRQSNRPLR